MKNENFELYGVNMASEDIPVGEILSNKHIRAVIVNFRLAESLKDSIMNRVIVKLRDDNFREF